MKIGVTFCLLTLSTLLLSDCNEPIVKTKVAHPDWDTVNLGGWTIQVPGECRVTFENDGENRSGLVYALNGEFGLEFSMWHETGADYNDCDEHDLSLKAASCLESCEEFYAEKGDYKIWLQFVNDHTAVFAKPTDAGAGDVSVHFSDCHRSLMVSSKCLTIEQQKSVLEIFETIDWNEDGLR